MPDFALISLSVQPFRDRMLFITVPSVGGCERSAISFSIPYLTIFQSGSLCPYRANGSWSLGKGSRGSLQGVTGRDKEKGKAMRFIRKGMIGLAAFAALPLAAQGPVAAPTVKKD